MSASTIVMVTGGNSGIGLGLVKRLAREPNYHIYLASRSLEKGKKALAEVQQEVPNRNVTLLELDILQQSSIENAAKTVEKEFGRLDALVNNAGVVHKGAFHDRLNIDITTNAIGPAMVTESFTPLLLKSSNARLLYVTSVLGSLDTMRNDPNLAHAHFKSYQMSKSALNMCAVEDHRVLGPKGVKVWTLCPGFVTSNLRGPGMDKAVEPGAISPTVPANFMYDVLEGKRDADVGKFIHREGLYNW